MQQIHHWCAPWATVHSFAQRGQWKPAPQRTGHAVLRPDLDGPPRCRCRTSLRGQGAQVFRGSVYWNVALGAVGSGQCVEDVSREEVCETCQIAVLRGWINGLDAGYDTVLAGSGEAEEQDGGVTLSGGMCQRLTLACARIRDSDVLILGASFFLLFVYKYPRLMLDHRRINICA